MKIIKHKECRILIVDDDAFMREMLSNDLEENGYFLVVAENGLKAAKFLDLSQVDIVITDIVMPDMDGLEFIMKLRKKHKNLAIFAMSGGDKKKDYLGFAKRLGADEVFAKPVDMEILLSKLEQYSINVSL